jgi:acyl dehydratase
VSYGRPVSIRKGRVVEGQINDVAYRVRARNPDTPTENRIHADDVAQRYGFQGGLVPGVTVYGYACHALVQALGPAWVEHGTAHMRFVAPCYDGDELAVNVHPAPSAPFEVDVRVGERTCVVGSAALADSRSGALDVPEIPAAAPPAPADRPALDAGFFVTGRVLGSVPLATDQASADAYLTGISEPSSAYAVDGVVHPGQLLGGANRVLTANVVLPAWLHVESEVRHLRAVAVGEPVQIRARIADVFERKGHDFVRLDVSWVAGSEPVAVARHTAIWRLAGS